MHAIPPTIAGTDVDPSGSYECPLCRVQSTGDEIDTGWVACPMVMDRMICLGSCIDYQKVARSLRSPDHPEDQMFTNLAIATRSSIEALRLKCLRHQVQIIDDQLRDGSEDASELRQLRGDVVREVNRDRNGPPT